MTVFKNKKIREILEYYKTPWALGYVSGVAHWDLETYMPEKGASVRGEALAKISSLRQKIFLDKHFNDLIHQSAKEKNLTDQERGVIRVLLRQLKYYEKLPASFIEESERLVNTSTVVWRKAKEKNDFKLFQPQLSKIFDMNRKMAEYLGYIDSPYDALLDQYEEGLMSDSVNQLFSEVKKPLKDLLDKIVSSNKYNNSHKLETTAYTKEKLMKLNYKILSLFWADFGRFRLDISSHPFTTSFSGNDTRITSWYHKTDFARSILATVHEFGHALYDLQCDTGLEMTPIQGGSSLVIHESQSRLWENFIGRSKPFVKKFLPDFSDAVNQKLNLDDVYLYFNKVSPSLLRVEADEVTYHFHIMLRFEIEKAIIEGKVKSGEVRDMWNAKMKEYLGVSPRSDSDGVLQDIHWSGGTVGYFPTYSLGTFLSAQWAEKINNSQGTIYNYEQTKKWLQEHIHKYGSTYTLQELLIKNKMRFDPTVNLKYLTDKYSKIYGF